MTTTVEKKKKKVKTYAAINYRRFRFSYYNTWNMVHEGMTCLECRDSVSYKELEEFFSFPEECKTVTVYIKSYIKENGYKIIRNEKNDFSYWSVDNDDRLLPEGLESLFQELGDALPETFYIKCTHG